MKLSIIQLGKLCFVTSFFMITIIIIFTPNLNQQVLQKYEYKNIKSRPNLDEWRNFSENQINKLSELGKYLYLFKQPKLIEPNRKYKILVWKYGKYLLRRHLYNFSNQTVNPFDVCSVNNCDIVYEDVEIKDADAVLFHLQRMKGVKDLPDETTRRPNQRWVFLTDETPFHTFLTGGIKLTDFNGKFNWSMTYRMDSDVPVPYGRSVLIPNSEEYLGIEFAKRQDVLIAVMGSNCHGRNKRWDYIKELQQHIHVDIYGGCGPLKCEGHFNKDCDKLNYYKFYLAFENSNCPEYITEKLWWNAYNKNSIPIVMGASKIEYKQLLPPKSYINIEDFASPADLARYILYINKTTDAYREYFEWKRHYKVLNEHAYFQSKSYHFCRLCEALNYNSKEAKVYEKLEDFWNVNQCYPSWSDIRNMMTNET